MTTDVDCVEFFDRLADSMNRRPERFSPLGPADMVVGISMQRPQGDFRAILTFEETQCTGVRQLSGDDPMTVDFCLAGPLESWREMFADIAGHGKATGAFTINSLALMGTSIRCVGSDPMGLDKFSRFNQTLQEFFDGAAAVPASSGG